MPVDTSIYANQKPIDPLAGLGQTIGIANGIVQNKLMQGTLDAKNSLGGIYSGALDPTTGQFNPLLLNKGIANNPNAGFLAPELAQGSANLQQTQLGNQGQTVGQANNRINSFYNALGPLIQSKGGLQYGDAFNTMTSMLQQGRLLPEDVPAVMSELNTNKKNLQAWGQNRFSQTSGFEGQTTGSALAVNPQTGAQPVGTKVQQLKQMTGAGGGGGNGIVTNLPPGPAGAIPASVAAFNTNRDAQTNYAQNIYQSKQALAGLEATNSGPGTEARQSLQSFMLALPGGIGKWLPGADPDSVKAYDEANKYLTAQAGQGVGVLDAGRSDKALNTALVASPSVHVSAPAAKDIQRASIGFLRSQNLAFQEFQKTGQDPSQFADWKANYENSIDPRALSADVTPKADRSKYYNSLSPGDKQTYRKTLSRAMQAGVVKPADVGFGAQQ